MSEFDKYLNTLTEQMNLNNSWSAQQAQKQMDFQERMSNTAHQREMFDLQAAGLNPVLTANQGASTPNGAMANNSGDTAAFASLLGTVLDTENANARAALAAATRSGSGYGNSLNGGFLQSILQAFGLRTSQAKGIADTVEILAEYFGISPEMVQSWITGKSQSPSSNGNSAKSFTDENGANWRTDSAYKNMNANGMPTGKEGFKYSLNNMKESIKTGLEKTSVGRSILKVLKW